MVNHFIDECYTQLAFSPVSNQENILDIISDTLQLRNEIIHRLKDRSSLDDSTTGKKYYTSLAEHFYKAIIELTERLNSLEY